MRRALLIDTNSRQNKIWLAVGWADHGYRIEWRWSGEPHHSRLLFRLDEGPWKKSKSFDDDVRPKLVFNDPRTKLKDS